jgi:hypothetical protein
MAPDGTGIVVLLLFGVAYLVLLALGLFVTYWIIRLAVRHGSLDARRRWRDDEERVQQRLVAEGYGRGGDQR